jgi:hypothetical protein
VLITPMQFGPTTRMSCRRAKARRRASVAAPEGPVSPNPAVSTTAAPTCADPHSSMTCSTLEAGTAMIAKSSRSGMAPTDG